MVARQQDANKTSGSDSADQFPLRCLPNPLGSVKPALTQSMGLLIQHNHHSLFLCRFPSLAMPLPNLRRIFSSSRTDDQERAVSRQAFFRFCSFLTSCAVIALLSSPKRRRAIGL